VVQRFRFGHDRPFTAANAAVRGHVRAYWERGPAQVPPCSGVTDVRVTARHVYHLMRGGRARWKMANATLHTLKNQGDHFEPHDGPGTQPLSGMLAMVLRRAFLVEQTPQRGWALCQAVGGTLGRKRLLGERMRALFYAYRLASRPELLEALGDGMAQHRPLLIIDPS